MVVVLEAVMEEVVVEDLARGKVVDKVVCKVAHGKAVPPQLSSLAPTGAGEADGNSPED